MNHTEKSSASISHEKQIELAHLALAERTKKAAAEEFRLNYHFMAPANWINDPNGLIFYKGEYHLFYQHHPYAATPGPGHWGHAISNDLVHWKHLPIALAPSELYDSGESGAFGCWSGSAVEHKGQLTLIYTGHVEGKNPEEVQCLATSKDGISFEKYAGNPVIGMPPEEGCVGFRDPKVWMYDNRWFMVIGSGKGDYGRIFLYESADLLDWTYRGAAVESDGTMGYMWECPDLFPLGEDGDHILVFSPMGIENTRTMYLSGKMDYEKGRFTTLQAEKLDYGSDFYAPQTFLDDQGRRILIGWMDHWDSKMVGKAENWFGAMSIPREVTLASDGTIRMMPITELKALRKSGFEFSGKVIAVDSEETLAEVRGNSLEIIVEFSPSSSSTLEFGIKVSCSESGEEETLIGYNTLEQSLFIDTMRSSKEEGKMIKAPLALTENGTIRLHIYMDRASLEVFANEGRRTISERFYPNSTSTGIKVFSKGGKTEINSFRSWNLQSIW